MLRGCFLQIVLNRRWERILARLRHHRCSKNQIGLPADESAGAYPRGRTPTVQFSCFVAYSRELSDDRWASWLFGSFYFHSPVRSRRITGLTWVAARFMHARLDRIGQRPPKVQFEID